MGGIWPWAGSASKGAGWGRAGRGGRALGYPSLDTMKGRHGAVIAGRAGGVTGSASNPARPPAPATQHGQAAPAREPTSQKLGSVGEGASQTDSARLAPVCPLRPRHPAPAAHERGTSPHPHHTTVQTRRGKDCPCWQCGYYRGRGRRRGHLQGRSPRAGAGAGRHGGD